METFNNMSKATHSSAETATKMNEMFDNMVLARNITFGVFIHKVSTNIMKQVFVEPFKSTWGFIKN